MIKNAYRLGVWGASGSGKSYKLEQIIKADKLDRLIVLDPMGDWKYKRGYKSYKSLPALYKAIKKNWNKKFKFVLDVEDKDNTPLPEILQRISKDLRVIQEPYNQNKDNKELTLVIDEMADFFPNRTLSKEEQEFSKLCRKGRHYGVNIIGASQRIAEVHPSFRGNLSRNYFFRQDEAIDINRCLQSLGTQYKSDLIGLADYEYLLKEKGQVTIHKKSK